MRLVQIVVFASLLSLSLAIECTIKPAPAVVDVDSAWNASLLGCTCTPLAVNEYNGPSKSNVAQLIIPAGAGFPVHRHPGKDEYLYFTGGSGGVKAWLPHARLPETFEVKAGSFHFLPAGGIHTVYASATEELKMIVWTSPGEFIIEVLGDTWPETLDVPAGKVEKIMDFMPSCPPGQEKASAEL